MTQYVPKTVEEFLALEKLPRCDYDSENPLFRGAGGKYGEDGLSAKEFLRREAIHWLYVLT